MKLSLIINQSGNVETIFDDELLLDTIGKINNVRRASHINFDVNNQVWNVVHALSGKIIFSHKQRSECLGWEVQNLGPNGEYWHGDRAA